ncbi:MAG: MFS transporter [Elusimicrobiota bacterium]
MRTARRLLAACLALLLAGMPVRDAAAAVAVKVKIAGTAAGVPGVAVPSAPLALNNGLFKTGATLSLGSALPTVNSLSAANAVAGASVKISPQVAPAEEVRPNQPAAAKTVQARAQKLSKEAAPLLAEVRAQETSAGGVYAAGRSLEHILTGRSARGLSVAAPVPVGRQRLAGLGRSLRSVFGLKHFSSCCDHGAAQSFELSEIAADVPAPELTPVQKKNFRYYAAAVSITKVGVETMNLVVPVLLLTQFGAATLVGALFISAEIGGMVAGWIAGPSIDRYGPSRVLASSAVMQMMAIGVIPLALALGVPVGVPVLFALFTINGIFGGVFDTARRAAMPLILGRHEGVLREHNGQLYIFREILSVAAVGAAGLLLNKLGALGTLVLHPASYALVVYFLIRLALNIRRSAGGSVRAAPEKKEEKPAIGDIFRGARIVWNNPTLRLGTMVNIPIIMLHKLFHALLAVVYATQILGNPALAAVMLMAWNAGELAAALYLRKNAKKSGASFGWLKYAAIMSLTAWALIAFPTIYVAAPVAFLLSTGNMSSELGLTAYFQAVAKKDEAGSVTGFIYSLATAVSMLGLLGMGWAFDALGAMTGFTVLAGLLSVAALFFLLSWHRLRGKINFLRPFRAFFPDKEV